MMCTALQPNMDCHGFRLRLRRPVSPALSDQGLLGFVPAHKLYLDPNKLLIYNRFLIFDLCICG